MNGGGKVPCLEVKTPRGTARAKDKKIEPDEKAVRKEQDSIEEEWIQGRMKANKRYRTKEGSKQRETNDKRQRRISPTREQMEEKHRKEEVSKPINFL